MSFIKNFLFNLAVWFLAGLFLFIAFPDGIKQMYEIIVALFPPWLIILMIITISLPKRKNH